MAPRTRRERLEVHRDHPPEVLTSTPADGPAVPDEADDEVTGHFRGAADPVADPVAGPVALDMSGEPDMYGVRISWQSEAVRIEAAEFLVATRVQESSRRRLARLTQRLREQARAQGRGA